jgi:c-di-GMP-binding flagellar brake protein YcgR
MNPFKVWLEKLFSRERRQAKRTSSVLLVAHYWDGAAPVSHAVRDISSTGLFLLTDQRWYPGTIIRMTLVCMNLPETNSQRAIQVLARIVRPGHDGVACMFILSDGHPGASEDELNSKTLNKFLKRLNDS